MLKFVFRNVADLMSFVIQALEITNEGYEDFMCLFLVGIVD